MKTTTRRVTTLEDNADIYQLRNTPDSEPVIERKDNITVVGYLVIDQDCPNPLEDCDGMGKIRSLSNRHINHIDIDEAEQILADNPYAVRLSYFEHGLCLWDVEGGERYGNCPDKQWDGVSFAGIWYPDDCCKEHIEMTAKTKAKRKLEAVKCAEQACSEYTKWANGECYGYVVERFEDGERTEDDSCWGFIGTEYAEQEMKSAMKHLLSK